MIEVVVNSQAVLVKAVGKDRGQSAKQFTNEVPPEYREYLGEGTWKVKNPWKFAYIPAIRSALEDAQRQMAFELDGLHKICPTCGQEILQNKGAE